MQTFKAFSALLSYPQADMLAALPEIADIVRTSPLIGQRERQGLLELVEDLATGDVLEAEERYVDLFDRGRALSLNLFEHLHGDSRDRGTAMVDLKQLYEASGFELATRELPDFLPVVLEYLSRRNMDEARELLTDCAHILKSIARAMIARQSQYAAVLQSLLVIAGEQPVDGDKIRPVKEPVELLDRNWAEQPAFAGASMPGNPGFNATNSEN
ncbi:MAG: nitrate reductase molybdenum cofactor assembly chaperone [Rhodobacteraceae bacterium]|nr:nitrate reductase molybdenum cofactor assembly chaperone [Paracoccaceae bacterium]